MPKVMASAKTIIKRLNGLLKPPIKGFAEAQFSLGVMYDEGQGVRQDYYKAVEWYTKAAKQGYADAQFNLALMYMRVKACAKMIRSG